MLRDETPLAKGAHPVRPEGGPFGQLSQFYGEYLGMERARVSLTDGGSPGLTVEGRTELSYQPPTGGSERVHT